MVVLTNVLNNCFANVVFHAIGAITGLVDYLSKPELSNHISDIPFLDLLVKIHVGNKDKTNQVVDSGRAAEYGRKSILKCECHTQE